VSTLALVLGGTGLVAGGAVGMWFGRRQTAHLMADGISRLDPEGAPSPHGPSDLIQRVERLVAADHASVDAMMLTMSRLRAALEQLPVGLVVSDASGLELVRNHAAASLIGVRYADALIGAAIAEHQASALVGQSRRQTLDVYGPPRRTVVVSSLPIDDDVSGRTLLVMIEDVTERTRLEAVRTDFVANMSHELRTPVGALALLAETLEGETDPELIDRLSSKLVVEAHRVSRTIDDLLELSRLEVQGEVVREVVNVGLVINEALDRVRSLADLRLIDVSVGERVRQLRIVGDRRQLVSAVANLLENAAKYSDVGGGVEVDATAENGWLVLSVTDHGIGIPARDIDRVFERFYRVDRARSRETGGTGLGLAIVRHVATNHGGTVSVRSLEGQGSMFTLRLPEATAKNNLAEAS
jgi:two-component system sensor histidine kinase SenX3